MCEGYVRICTDGALHPCSDAASSAKAEHPNFNRFIDPVLFHANLLHCLQDGCIGSCRFEVAMKLVLLFVNRFEENEAAADIYPELSCFPYAGSKLNSVDLDGTTRSHVSHYSLA